jgi:AmmeMemoRadiSam system protein B
MEATSRPALRAVESIVVPDETHGRVLVLRDPHGVGDSEAVLPPPLVPVVALFTGQHSCLEIARDVSAQIGADVPVAVVVQLAEQLERGLFLEGPAFREARARVEREFAALAVRPASHSGGAYYRERAALERYIQQACLRKEVGPASGQLPGVGPPGVMAALVAPHIDPWRGAVGYGHAYGALADAISTETDTFVLFGTSHAPMREPFALCRKAFDTPLGPVDADVANIDILAEHAQGFDPYADQFNHKREHSIEFQAVFLKAVLPGRSFRIVPILAGLGSHQATGEDPARDPRVSRFLEGVRDLVDARPGRVVVVAGADLAHVGPRFGDESPLDGPQRASLERADRESLDHAASLDAGGFWAHVAHDLDARRVCGLAPIWSLLRSLSNEVRGRILHYEQTVDRDDGSLVSHAAVGFYR